MQEKNTTYPGQKPEEMPGETGKQGGQGDVGKKGGDYGKQGGNKPHETGKTGEEPKHP